eukprot:TRINITY_DN4766_c0_g1_i2.p1 TRINITY_DN4766_c0_g1~~TRINITY_DN4766_c0_g1_i2.p1  ORF type:complete len:477 (-),score=125.03 TRINITY_DN4766_c0_g1_i2:208-1638(-)
MDDGLKGYYSPQHNYYYLLSPYTSPRKLSFLVVPMQPNFPPYVLFKDIKGNYYLGTIGTETSLKEIFSNDLSLSHTIFDPYSHQNPPLFRVYRRSLDVIKELVGKSLHVLILKSDGHKFPRNPNAHVLELYCGTYFFGPLVVAVNHAEKPYVLESFGFEELELLKADNMRVHRVYPPPYDNSYPVMENADNLDHSFEEPVSVEGKGGGREKKYSDQFFMYRYKTGYCPDIANKHDWTACIYAHRFTDYRRPPDQFKYSPEDCVTLNTETGECPEGDDCNFAHSTAERLYHPLKYKTSPCDCFKKALPSCKRGQYCAFYHNASERRQAGVASKNPFKKKLPISAATEDLKTPPPFIPCDPQTDSTDEPNFFMQNRRRNYTVYTKPQKLIPPRSLKSSFAIDEPDLSDSRSVLSSIADSFCESKGLPYYTKLAFEPGESDGEAKERTEGESDKIEDKFNVLGQIFAPKDEATAQATSE